MRVNSLVCAAFVATATAAPESSKKTPGFSWKKTKSLIAFGDSYSYVQGLLGHPNYTYIGDNFNPSFTPAELFSNRIVQNQTSTASGGPIWTEYITNCGVAPGLTDPRTCSKQLWDFAYAGANTDTILTPPHWNHTVSLSRQIGQFETHGDPALQHVLHRTHALVSFWIGINDINDLFKQRGANTSFTPLYNALLATQLSLWERIYTLGYRSFLLLNLPPLDRGPSASLPAALVRTYNALLAAHARDFQTARPDATVLLFDVNAVLNRVFDDAAQYGFTNTTAFCPGYNQPDVATDPGKYGCGAGLGTYLWFNSGHLTSRVHEVFSKELVEWLGRQGE